MTTHRLHECSETVGEGIEISPHEPHASTRVAYPGPQGRELGGGAEIGEMETSSPRASSTTKEVSSKARERVREEAHGRRVNMIMAGSVGWVDVRVRRHVRRADQQSGHLGFHGGGRGCVHPIQLGRSTLGASRPGWVDDAVGHASGGRSPLDVVPLNPSSSSGATKAIREEAERGRLPM